MGLSASFKTAVCGPLAGAGSGACAGTARASRFPSGACRTRQQSRPGVEGMIMAQACAEASIGQVPVAQWHFALAPIGVSNSRAADRQ